MQQRDDNRRLALSSIFMALGTVLWVVEELIPKPMPWMKPGLANCATLLAMFTVGPLEAIIVAVGRVFLGSLLLGRIGSPGFIISLSASITSAVMMIAVRYSKIRFSIFGVSIFGAIAHSLTQLLIAGMMIHNLSITSSLLPLVLLPSIPSGIIVAFIVMLVLSRTNIRSIEI
ncbi:Gx transporter family protein [bacterium]|nr:Gx transporter family protein [bacterium]